jgi:hypothetical protein
MPNMVKELQLTLCHALKFIQAKYISYFTRSNMEIENRELLHITMSNHLTEAESDNNEHFFEIEFSTGNEDKGFLSLLKKAPPKPSAAASDVIAQAILKGVLTADDVLSSEYSTQSAQSKKKRKMKKRLFSQHEGIPMTFAAQQKVVQKKFSINEKSRPFLM